MENFYFPNLHTKYIHDIYFNNDIDLLIMFYLFICVGHFMFSYKCLDSLKIMSPNYNLKVD